MFKWIPNNKLPILFLALAAIVALALTACAGLQLTDYVRVRVPPVVQGVIDCPATIPLTNATALHEEWKLKIRQADTAFSESINRGYVLYDVVGSLLNTGMTQLEGPLSTIPAGGLGIAALTGLGALFINRPGTAQFVQKAKEASYNAGLTKGGTLP